jgi:hypothetical protein
MPQKQKRMVGHGAIIMFIGMLAGFGLLSSLIGGLELIPGSIIEFSIPGDSGSWARAHMGGMFNGVFIMLVALLILAMKIADKPAGQLYWMLIGTGYANTIFYWAALLAPNRALTFADNVHGESNLWAIVGLLPALVFAIVSLVAVFILIRQAFAKN